MDKNSQKIVKKIIESPEGFIKENGYKLVEVKEDYCKLEGTIETKSMNPYGIVHGGYIFGLADTAGGVVAGLGGRGAVTTNANISYFHKTTGTKIYAVAKCLKRGLNLVNCEVEIIDEKGIMVAKCSLEYFYI